MSESSNSVLLHSHFVFNVNRDGKRVSGICRKCFNVTVKEKHTANYWHHLKRYHGYVPTVQNKNTDSSSSTESSDISSSEGRQSIAKEEKMDCEHDTEDSEERNDEDSDGRVRKRKWSDSIRKQGVLGFPVVSASNLSRFQQLTAETFAKLGLPHRLIENSDFKEWMAEYEKLKCEQQMKFTTRRRLRNLICLKGEESFKEVLEALRGQFITLAIDGWTGQKYGAKNTNIIALARQKSYLLWSDRNDEQKDCADTYLFPLVSEKIKELKDKDVAVCAITTDNAANMVRIGTLLYQLPNSGPVILHLSCSAHSIQLMLQEIVELDPVQSLIKKALSIIDPFTSKGGKQWRLELRRVQLSLDTNKAPLRLVHFNQTRWLSRFECIARLIRLKLQLKLVFTRLATSQYSFVTSGTDTFWQRLEGVVYPLLKAFKLATNMVQQDAANLHTLDEALEGIRKAVYNCKPADHGMCSAQSESKWRDATNKILDDRIKLFIAANGNHYAFWAVSLLTDKKSTRWEASQRSVLDLEDTITWLTHWGADVTFFYPKLFGHNTDSPKTKSMLVAELHHQITEFQYGLGCFQSKDVFLKTFIRHIPPNSFAFDKNQPQRCEIDWLLFWNKMKMYAPELAHVAVCLLSLGVSEASCERSFSIQQLTHSKLRNRLDEDIVQAEMRLRYNKRALNHYDADSEDELSDSE